MKKVAILLLAFISLFTFAGCSAIRASSQEKKMLEYDKFVLEGQTDESEFLVMSKDHTYSLHYEYYDQNTYKAELKTFEGSWSHAYTYKYDYTYLYGILDVELTESSIISAFKLENCTINDEQVYFCFGTYSGNIIKTNEEINQDYFDGLRKEVNGEKKGVIDLGLIWEGK